MTRKRFLLASVVGASAILVAGIAAGGALASAAGGAGPTLPSSAEYQTNDAGQTYGSNLGSPSADADPDLVLVIGDSGREGYVYADALNGEPPRSPEDALAAQVAPGEVAEVLPVFELDGVTKIDTFTILGGYETTERETTP